MKNLFGFILSLGLVLNSCKLMDNSNYPNSNFYRGHGFFVEIFMTISNDTAIAEWYYLDGPCQAFSDTLIANIIGSKDLIGKKSRVSYKNNGNMYFQAVIPYEPPKLVNIRMKPDNNYKKKYENIRNKYMNGKHVL